MKLKFEIGSPPRGTLLLGTLSYLVNGKPQVEPCVFYIDSESDSLRTATGDDLGWEYEEGLILDYAVLPALPFIAELKGIDEPDTVRGRAGGLARARKLSKAQRVEIATKAAKTRWSRGGRGRG